MSRVFPLFSQFPEPIAKYWPEFGQNGKESITLEDLMKHEGIVMSSNFKLNCLARLPYFDIPIPLNIFLGNHESNPGMKLLIEKSHPALDAGVSILIRCELLVSHLAGAYHGVTRGLIENELVKIVDPMHRDLGTIFRDEVAKPLGAGMVVPLSKFLFNA
jgi:CubicO group peptidase (beta-lactamase class C family)